jgi:hypothetical protein
MIRSIETVATMAIETTATIVGLIIGFSTVITVSAAGVRWLVKHYFAEIKAEFKPNGGSSLKDQVNRLEAQHGELKTKVDKIYDVIVENGLKSNSKKTK